jgi:hypothetical protein
MWKTMQGAEFSQPGKSTLVLPDGTAYAIESPTVELAGLLTAAKSLTLAGNLIITDKKNGLRSVTSFDTEKGKRAGYLGGFIGGGHGAVKEGEVSAYRTDLLRVEISKPPGNKKEDIVSEGSGSYLEQITFDGEEMWSVNTKGTRTTFIKPDKTHEKGSYVLTSDSIRRPDGLAIQEEKWDDAEEEKKKLEELQRADAKLRKEA